MTVAPIETVRVEVAEPPEGGVTCAGFKVVVTPGIGVEVTERSTGWLKPCSEVIVIVDVSELPWAMVREVGAAEIEKSGGGETVRLMSTV